MLKKSMRPARSTLKATRDDWLNQALATLISDGVDAVLVLPLARKLKVSRSSFYWYFRNRKDLLDHLLQHWMSTNTSAIIEHAGRPSRTAVQGVLHIFECWVSETTYSPRLDIAVRNWATKSNVVRALVEKADDARLVAIKQMFQRHGFDEEDAFIRARILYYVQVGYYALELKETMEARLSHIEAYLRAFTGEEPARADVDRFRNFVQDALATRAQRKRRRGR
ncbi:TetR/AcrR family transcriptional regulator [Taklimakanibacter lacteus]|uniref:TetR/AcrR family transcriptional regulator n=1 Tax=Taklimakanibacter lacteus TaxID=2268456 RepID=UPI000E6606CA